MGHPMYTKETTPDKATKKKRLQKRFNNNVGRSDITIAHAWSNFIVSRMERGTAQATIDYYKRFYTKFCKFLGSTPSGWLPEETEIEILELEGFQAMFVASMGDVKKQTINNYLRAYKAFGNFCLEKGFIENFKCKIIEEEPPIKNVYNAIEIDKLLLTPDKDNFTDHRNHTIITLMLATGARTNTILNIKIKDVDLDTGEIAFNTTKAHRVVLIPLDKKSRLDIKEYILTWRTGEDVSENDYLFCNVYGEQLTRAGLDKAIAVYNKNRGVTKTSLHLFRHTFSKNWIKSGGDVTTLAKVLTHSEMKMVQRYANLYNDDIRDEMEQHSIISNSRKRSGSTLTTKRRNK